MKTLKGKPHSTLNKTISKSYYDLKNDDDMEAYYKNQIESDKKHQKFESLDSALSDEIKKVKNFLDSLNIPSDENANYNFEYNFDSNKIIINEKKYNTSFPESFKENRNAQDFKAIGTGSGSLPSILKEWFSHIPAVSNIAEFLYCMESVQRFRKSGDIDRCAAYAIRGMAHTRKVVIAEYEDYEISEHERHINKAFIKAKIYIAKRFQELEASEGLGHGNIKKFTDIIYDELQKRDNKKITYPVYTYDSLVKLITDRKKLIDTYGK